MMHGLLLAILVYSASSFGSRRRRLAVSASAFLCGIDTWAVWKEIYLYGYKL